MTRMKFTAAAVAWLSVLLLVCAGCGDGGGSSRPSRPPKPSASSTPSTSAGGSSSAAAEDDQDWDKLEGWGHLTGTILYDGVPPKPKALEITKDTDYCGKAGLKDETLLVSENGGVANVVVYLYDSTDKLHQSYVDNAELSVTLDNKECRFVPHVVPLTLAQKLLVKNSDPIAHNTNCQPLGDEGFNPLLPTNGDQEFTFARQQNVPVPVACNIHPWMKGYVFPRKTPYVVVTDADGKFKLENLPAGKWEFRFWHESKGYLKTGPWYEKDWVKIGIKPDETTDLGAVSLPAAAFGQ